MALTTKDALLEAWAEQIETMEQNLESIYGPPGITPTLPDITTENGMLEAIAEQAEKTCWAFAKMYNYFTKETGATYTVTVPDTALYYGNVVKVGGNTISENETLASAEVTKIVSKDANGNVIDTLDIPDEVQAIEGYGWGAGDAYNYIDFENKKFIQNVGKVILDGTQAVVTSSFTSAACKACYAVTGSSAYTTGGEIDKGIISSYLPASSNSLTNTGVPGIHRRANGSSQVYVSLGIASGISDATAFNAYLSEHPLTVYYELATPVETDISAYITDTDIKIVPGGTLTFVNEHELNLVSEVEYIS